MKFYVRSFLGLIIFFFAFVCFEWAIYHFLQIGTCSSGGPYISRRQCPSGTIVLFAAVFGGIILGLIGIGIYALRGRPPDADDSYQGPRVPFGILAWSLLFAGTAVVSLWAVVGPNADPGPGAKTGAIIVAIVFLPMGIIPLLLAARRDRSSSSVGSGSTILAGLPGSSSYGPTGYTPPGPGGGGGGGYTPGSGVVAPLPPSVPAAPRRPMPAPPVVKPGGGAPGAAPKGEEGLEQLEKLKKLRDAGALTDAEFASAKAKILADL
jgi:hypothetical protein